MRLLWMRVAGNPESVWHGHRSLKGKTQQFRKTTACRPFGISDGGVSESRMEPVGEKPVRGMVAHGVRSGNPQVAS